ncbi:hypothetical protein [Piscinibacter sp. XHJ-5]|uniref:hypothetical protein n=1 Tax=Piscinibacter sp. XHJ-5 TaxID=3037797 RepID=UPI002453507C|nr:hypothetical protein [Piscinibacter sp. XHJ-5]
MRLVDIRHRDAMSMAVAEIHERPVVVQLPAVFVLLAAPTTAGAAQLDRAKTRLPGKHYGTAIGSLDRFLAQADPAHLPPGFSQAEDFMRMTGTFSRVRFRGLDFDSPTIRGGTHQGVLLNGLHRSLFERIEASFLTGAPDPIWGGHNYCAPLCTSCNISGHPDGSIVELEKALAFARDRGVRLVITGPQRSADLGSYPIFGYERDRVRVHRVGPGLEAFKQKIPPALRAW